MVMTLVLIAAVVCGLLGILLAVPLSVTVEAESRIRVETQWRVRWLGWVIDSRLRRGRHAGAAGAKIGRARDPHVPLESEAGANKERSSVMTVLRTPGLVRRLRRLLMDVSRRTTIQDLRVAFGLDNPADTGVIYGMITPLLVSARAHAVNVVCLPLFDVAEPRATVAVTVRFRPLTLVATAAAFLVSPAVIRAMARAWRLRH